MLPFSTSSAFRFPFVFEAVARGGVSRGWWGTTGDGSGVGEVKERDGMSSLVDIASYRKSYLEFTKGS